MPYIVLIIGILLGLLGLYRFILSANIAQIKALFLTAGLASLVIAIFFLALTGRLPAAFGLLVALTPFAAMWLKHRKAANNPDSNTPPSGTASPSGPMSREEALEILGLEETATPEEIKAAYKRLIKKAHPDQEGSQWIAAKLNLARDCLLTDKQ